MTLIVPRIEDFNDPRQQFLMQQFMKELLDMSFKLTFLPKSGTISGGRRPWNFDAIWVAYVSNGVADTEDTVAHNLGRTPQDMIIGIPDKSARIYRGTTAWTSSNIFLKSSAATTTVNLVVY